MTPPFKALETGAVSLEVDRAVSAQTLVYYYDERHHAWIAVPTKANGKALTAQVPKDTWVTVMENPAVFLPSDTQSNWANRDIMKLISLNVITGFEDRSFRPNETTNRYQMSVVIAKALGLDMDSVSMGELEHNEQLSNVPSWAKPYVAAMLQSRLMVGSESGFNGDGAMTRAQLAVIVGRVFANADGADAEEPVSYSDSNLIPEWAADGIRIAKKYGIILGYPDGAYKPDQQVTRAEMAAIISRLMDELALQKLMKNS